MEEGGGICEMKLKRKKRTLMWKREEEEVVGEREVAAGVVRV